jgi:hypothetical protein
MKWIVLTCDHPDELSAFHLDKFTRNLNGYISLPTDPRRRMQLNETSTQPAERQYRDARFAVLGEAGRWARRILKRDGGEKLSDDSEATHMIVGDGKLNQPVTDVTIRTILLQKTDFTLSNTDVDVCFHHQRQLRISRKGQ